MLNAYEYTRTEFKATHYLPVLSCNPAPVVPSPGSFQ